MHEVKPIKCEHVASIVILFIKRPHILSIILYKLSTHSRNPFIILFIYMQMINTWIDFIDITEYAAFLNSTLQHQLDRLYEAAHNVTTNDISFNNWQLFDSSFIFFLLCIQSAYGYMRMHTALRSILSAVMSTSISQYIKVHRTSEWGTMHYWLKPQATATFNGRCFDDWPNSYAKRVACSFQLDFFSLDEEKQLHFTIWELHPELLACQLSGQRWSDHPLERFFYFLFDFVLVTSLSAKRCKWTSFDVNMNKKMFSFIPKLTIYSKENWREFGFDLIFRVVVMKMS